MRNRIFVVTVIVALAYLLTSRFAAAASPPLAPVPVAILNSRADPLGLGGAVPPVPGVEFRSLRTTEVSPTTLAQYPGVALIEPCRLSPPLTSSQERALSDYLASGGMLILYTADRCNATSFSWLGSEAFATDSPGPRGSHDGKLWIPTDTRLASGSRSSSSFLDLRPYEREDDSGDVEVMQTEASNWCSALGARNINGRRGSAVSYAWIGARGGLVVWVGLDVDQLSTAPLMRQLWQNTFDVLRDRAQGVTNLGLPAAPSCVRVVDIPQGPVLADLVQDVEDTMTDLAPVFVIIGLLFLVWALVQRNRLMHLINRVDHAFAALGHIIASLGDRAISRLDDYVERFRRTSHDWPRSAKSADRIEASPHHEYELVAPTIPLITLLVFFLAHIVFAGLRSCHALGLGCQEVPLTPFLFGIPIEAAAFAASILLAFAVFAWVLLETHDASPVSARPYGNMPAHKRRWVQIACWVGLVVSAITLLLFAIYGAAVLNNSAGALDDSVAAQIEATIRWPMFPLYDLCIAGAAALLMWSTWVGLSVVFLLGALIFRYLILTPVRAIGEGEAWLFDVFDQILVAILDVFAGPPRQVWNRLIANRELFGRELGRIEHCDRPSLRWYRPTETESRSIFKCYCNENEPHLATGKDPFSNTVVLTSPLNESPQLNGNGVAHIAEPSVQVADSAVWTAGEPCASSYN